MQLLETTGKDEGKTVYSHSETVSDSQLLAYPHVCAMLNEGISSARLGYEQLQARAGPK